MDIQDGFGIDEALRNLGVHQKNMGPQREQKIWDKGLFLRVFPL